MSHSRTRRSRRVDPELLYRRCREMLVLFAESKPRSFSMKTLNERFPEWGERWVGRCLRRLLADGYARRYDYWYYSTAAGDAVVNDTPEADTAAKPPPITDTPEADDHADLYEASNR